MARRTWAQGTIHRVAWLMDKAALLAKRMDSVPGPELSTWAERRPPRTEHARHQISERYSAHLPETVSGRTISDRDLNAMKAAFIKRFDEDLPRTETLMAVANIGYRMALRDMGHKL